MPKLSARENHLLNRKIQQVSASVMAARPLCSVKKLPFKSESISEEPNLRRAAAFQLGMTYVAMAISIVQSIVLVPLYISSMGEKTYGLWLASGGIIAFLGMLDIGIAALQGQRIAAAYGRRDMGVIGKYYSSGNYINNAISLLVLLAAFLIACYAPKLLGSQEQESAILSAAIVIAGSAAALSFAINTQQVVASALQRPLVPLLNSIVANLIGLALTVWLLYREYGVLSIPAGQALSAILTYVGGAVYVNSLLGKFNITCAPDKSIIKELLSYSPEMFLAKSASAVVSRIEPLVISIALAPESAVAFSVNRRAAEVLQMTVDRITGASTAGFTHLHAQGNAARTASTFRLIYSAACVTFITGIVAFILLNESFISLWVGAGFYLGSKLTLLFGISFGCIVFHNLFTAQLAATGEIALTSRVTFLEAIARIATMCALVNQFKFYALPIGVIVSTGASMLFVLMRLLRKLQIQVVVSYSIQRLVPAVVLVGCGVYCRAAIAPGTWCEFMVWGVAILSFAACTVLWAMPSCYRVLREAIGGRSI